jgi:shikimate kinase
MPQTNPVVFIIGFMGSGKTTIAKKLAARMHYDCVDLDSAIEKTEGLYIRDIIKEKGEGYFREIEAHTLKHLPLTKKIIATGGGTPCYFDNIQWMKSKGTVVFVDMEEGMLFSRLKSTNIEYRPLLKDLDDDGLKAFIHEKLQERLPYYLQADLTISGKDISVADLAEKLETLHKV